MVRLHREGANSKCLRPSAIRRQDRVADGRENRKTSQRPQARAQGDMYRSICSMNFALSVQHAASPLPGGPTSTHSTATVLTAKTQRELFAHSVHSFLRTHVSSIARVP